MHKTAIILWVIGSLAIIWIVGWILSRGLPMVVGKTSLGLSRVNDRLPLFMRPIEHTILCLLLGSLTIFIAKFPDWPPWRFVVGQQAQAQLHPGTLIGASAALLALLLFAANQLRNFEKESSSDNQFMGENLDTYLAQRSRIVRVLGLPIFHVAVGTLFIIPLVWYWLPDNIDTHVLWSFVPSVIAAPQLLAIAFWCASFAVVSGILLLNVLGTLHNSTLGFHRPTGLKLRVRADLRQTAESVYTAFFRYGEEGRRDEIYLWTSKILKQAGYLPADQRVDYVNLMLGSLSYRALREESRGKYLKLRKKLQVTKAKTSPTLKAASSCRRKRRVSRAKNILRVRTELAYGRMWAILEYLRNHDLSQHLQARLIGICLDEARQTDNDCERILGISWSEGGIKQRKQADDLTGYAYDILTRSRGQIPEIAGGFRHYSLDTEEGPRLQGLSAFVYRSLGRALFPSSGASRAPATQVEEIVSAANTLFDQQTREYALRQVLMAMIDCTIINRQSDETIEINQLETMLRRRNSYVPEPRNAANTPKSFEKIIEECAFYSLVSNTRLEPYQRTALLAVTSRQQAVIVLLYLLFYGVRSSAPLQVVDLHPFLPSLRDFRWGSGVDNHSVRRAAANYIQDSNVSHFVGDPEVHWLFDALEEPLSVELCVKFLEQRDQGRFMDFGLLQFVQWRVIAAETSYVVHRNHQSIAPSHTQQLHQAKLQVQEFAKDWQVVDPVIANMLDDLLLQFP